MKFATGSKVRVKSVGNCISASPGGVYEVLGYTDRGRRLIGENVHDYQD